MKQIITEKKSKHSRFLSFPGTYLITIAVTLVILLLTPLCKKEQEKSSRGFLIIDAKDKNFILPKPSELFYTMNKIQKHNWKNLATVNRKTNYSSDIQLALNFGARSADGLVLLYANERKNSGEVITTLNDLAKQLDLDKIMSVHLKEIDSYARKGENEKIRIRLDKIQASLEKALIDRGDNDLSVFLNLGGWLEGMYLASSGINRNYKSASAELLRHAEIVDVFISSIDGMNTNTRNHPVVKTIRSALPEIRKLMDVPGGKSISPESISKLLSISKKLKNSVEKPQ